ncbi:MAG: hypothetical protein HC801_10025 [Nitrospira sp.]|nr:hypothetical protein [Nitrospira sp.]
MSPVASTTGSFRYFHSRSFGMSISIPLGVDFRAYLDEPVAKCDVFLAVIGRDWMKAKGRKGKSRLEDPGDFVRIEIESALKRQIPVIPVLVGGAKRSHQQSVFLPAFKRCRTGTALSCALIRIFTKTWIG